MLGVKTFPKIKFWFRTFKRECLLCVAYSPGVTLHYRMLASIPCSSGRYKGMLLLVGFFCDFRYGNWWPAKFPNFAYWKCLFIYTQLLIYGASDPEQKWLKTFPSGQGCVWTMFV